jgi:hypothetical protein
MAIVLGSLRSIFAKQPASFSAACTMAEAVGRLRAAAKHSAWKAWLEARSECLVGRVSEDAVAVWWYRGPRTPLPAVFRGAFSEASDSVLLTGAFQHRTIDRLLLTAAAAILLLFLVASVAGLAAVFVSVLSLGDRLLAGGFLGALAVGAAIATFCAVNHYAQTTSARCHWRYVRR